MGVTERQLLDLPRYRTSAAFNDTERMVIDLAVEMVKTPAEIPDELLARLHAKFDEAQLVELAATIAWENYLSRFNRVFRIESSGFSEGAVCALREHAS
jgi:alkylhydroperoxidase family enzyme